MEQRWPLDLDADLREWVADGLAALEAWLLPYALFLAFLETWDGSVRG